MWGLGSTDMKSGVAVMTSLGLDLEWWRLPVRLALVYYKGEEGSFEENTLGPMLDEMPWLLEAGLAVLLEPTANHIEMGCVGSVNIEVMVRGEPCHSARPWLGRSAVSEAAAWIGEMSRKEPRERIVGGLSFKETAAITLLRAGSARNVIPGSLTAGVNLRYAPDRRKEDAVRDLVDTLPRDWEWREVDHAPAGKIDAEAPLLRRFTRIVECPHRGKQGWTDVARFTARGVPALNFGPGLPEYAHRRDEQVPIRNLEVSARWLRLFLESESP
jgi:succinyl-diaminopimelate desuccinylase